MGTDAKVKLQVQIAVFGEDGMKRVLEHRHPRVEGVRYLVSWQMPEGEATVPEDISRREDFDVIISNDRGLARNRNHALDYECDSEYALLADDDVDYSEEGLKKVIQGFEEHPAADILCFRYRCNGKYVKNYGEGKMDVKRPPFGWYPTTFEIAYRRKSLGKVRFNENMGIGSGKLVAGEDTVWFYDMLKSGANGWILPLDICEHNQSTTGERCAREPEFLEAQGAILTHIKPKTWIPRVILMACRSELPFFTSLRYITKGARRAFREHLFRD